MVKRKKSSIIYTNIITGVLTTCCLVSSAMAAHSVTGSGNNIVITNDDVQMRINLKRFRYSFAHNGETVAPAHSGSGLTFSGGPAARATYNPGRSDRSMVHFTVFNSENKSATVKVFPTKNSYRISVEPTNISADAIAARVGPVGGPIYGLGDRGERGNMVSGGTVTDAVISNTGDGARFISSFLIAPTKDFAQVAISKPEERLLLPRISTTPHIVSANSDRMEVRIRPVKSVRNFYYFAGDIREIYAAFSAAKKKTGFGDAKPHYDMFGIGWEAWPFLRWETNAQTVQSIINEFLSADNDYPLHWAVIGSGFWEENGTTVSFGRWNKTLYPSRNGTQPDLVRNLRRQGLKVMLGLRTTFTDCFGANDLDRGRPGQQTGCSGSRPTFTPEFIEGSENNYFAKIAGGKDYITGSNVFPKWGSTGPQSLRMLDVTNPAAIRWYVEKTKLWGVDGWKEDSMMSFRPTHTYHDAAWNLPMKKLHDRGDFVMARNAYVGNPGSILRINDTFGEQDRIPRLVMAYAASGVPNIYTDSIGNDDRENARYLERHAKLSAVSPVMAFGVKPWDFPNEANFRAAVDWHEKYRPYIYSAALKSFDTGYPHTVTPLPIAYPNDSNTYNLDDSKMWEWLIDDSILATPLFDRTNTSTARDVYLPEGIWMDMNTNIGYSGNQRLVNHDQGGTKIPAFVGGKGVVISTDGNRITAEIWPIKPNNRRGVTYQYRHFKADSRGRHRTSKITLNNTGWDINRLSVVNITNGSVTPIDKNRARGGISFKITPGHDYWIDRGGTLPPGGPQFEVTPGVRNVALNKPVRVDTTLERKFAGQKAVDGNHTSNDSRWISKNNNRPHFIEVDLQAPTYIQEINFWTGYNNVGPLESYVLSYRQNGEWRELANVRSNTQSDVQHRLSRPVKATKIRLASREWMKIYDIEAIGLSSEFSLLSDNFNDRDIAGWQPSSGSWNASSGAIMARKRGGASSGHIVRGQLGWRNYFVTADVTIPTRGESAGISGRYSNENNFYLLRIKKNTNKIQLLKKHRGRFTLIAEANLTVRPNVSHNLRLAMQGKELRGFVDGRLLISATDGAHSQGRIGLRFFDDPNNPGSAAIFDNVGAGHN